MNGGSEIGGAKAFTRGVTAVCVCLALAPSASAAAGDTVRASVSAGGTQGNQPSFRPAISGNGNFVAFTSGASNLVPGDANGKQDVFIRNMTTGEVELISQTTAGAQLDKFSHEASVSANGRLVAFSSEATNLGDNDVFGGFGPSDIFVRDRQTGTTEHVSPGGGPSVNYRNASISANGRYVAYLKYEDVLGDSVNEVVVYDRNDASVEVASAGQGAGNDSFGPSLSADGRRVAFTSSSGSFTGGDANGAFDVYMRDLDTNAIERVSVDSGGGDSNGISREASISGDGTRVAFTSEASDLTFGDNNNGPDIFVRDLPEDTTGLASVSSGGLPGGAQGAGYPQISGNGRFVSFESAQSNLVPGDTNGETDVFVRHLLAGITERISLSTAGAQGFGASQTGLSSRNISDNGRFVAFHSDAFNLVSGDTNGFADVFVREREVDGAQMSFSAPQNVSVGAGPYSVATGNFTNDDDLDLAVPNEGSDTVSILTGDGAGGFTLAQTFAVGDQPKKAVVADFNNDGDDDIVVANMGSDNVTVMLGEGGADFGTEEYPAGDGPVGVASADFDGGRLDLAVANYFSGTVSILSGDIANGFDPATSVSVGSLPQAVAVGRFDSALGLDLAVANSGDDDVSVLRGNHEGGFPVRVDVPVGDTPVDVFAGHINTNGVSDFEDIATANFGDGTASVLLSDAFGDFGNEATHLVGGAPTWVAGPDLDNDADADLVTTNSADDTVSVLLEDGTGAGTFEPQQTFPVGDSPYGVAAGRFSGGAAMDLAVANRGSNNVSILLQEESGADLTVSKSDDPDPVAPGDPLTYTIQVENLGPDSTDQVTVDDAMPEEIPEDVVPQVSADGWTCEAEYNDDFWEVHCDLDDPLGVEEAPPIEIAVDSPDVPGTISNAATVDGFEPDPDPDNGSDIETTTIEARQADLYLEKSDSADPVQVGDEFIYTLDLTNDGPDDEFAADDAEVVDILPNEVEFVSAASPGDEMTCSAFEVEDGGIPTGETGVTCADTDGQLNVDQTDTATITVVALTAGDAENTASIGPDGLPSEDPDPSDNTASETTTIEAGAAPANDDFADAEPLGDLPASADGTTAGAGSEPGEPNHGGGGGQSVWYLFSPDEDDVVTIEACEPDSGPEPDIAVYTGSSLAALERAGGREGSCGATVAVEGGTTYLIAVDSSGDTDFTLDIAGEALGEEPFADAGSLISPRGGTEVGGPDGQHPTTPPDVPTSDEAPIVSIKVTPKRLRAGQRAELSAARSDDPDGTLTAFEWDLDGDGVFDDAVGERVDTVFALPGSIRVAAQVYDDGGLTTVGEKIVKVRKGGRTLDPPKELVTGQKNPRPGQLDLSSGYAGWDPTGKAFGRQPASGSTVNGDRILNVGGALGGDYADVGLPVGLGTGSYATSFKTVKRTDLTPEASGNLAVGRIASPKIPLTSSGFVSFLLGGDGDGLAGQASKTRIEVWGSKPGAKSKPFPELSTAAPPGGGAMREINLDVSGLQDQGYTEVVLVAVDDFTGGHVMLDALGTNAPQYAEVIDQPGVIDEIDVPRRFPMSGFADPHAHVMAHQGFGGLRGIRTYMGVPGGAVQDYIDNPAQYKNDVGRDQRSHFGGVLAAFILDVFEGRKSTPNGLGDVVTGLAQAGHNDGKPGPAHQSMHITDLHRAWKGGQRLITSIAVTNAGAETLMSEANTGAAPTTHSDDLDVIEAHVRGMRELAAKNFDWMEIVYSPREAYNTIAEGKLAVVLGTEVDSNGSLGTFPSAAAEVDHLWRLGIRQVTAVHAVDNEVGGAAVFQDGYNTLQDWLRRPPSTSSYLSDVLDHQNIPPFSGTDPGLLVDRRRFPGTRLNAKYGDFMDIERYGCDQLNPGDPPQPPRGECVKYEYKPQQTLFTQFGVTDPLPPFNYRGLIFPQDVTPAAYQRGTEPGVGIGQRNQNGLTNYGRTYIRALMNRGMLIDIEHASDKTFNAITARGVGGDERGPVWDSLPTGVPGCDVNATAAQRAADRICWTHAYPLMSSHTSFRGLALHGQTTVKDWRPSEFDRTPTQIEYMRLSGGIIAPFVGQEPTETPQVTSGAGAPDWRLNDADDLQFATGAPANNCAGTTRGWMNSFLYGAAKMQGDPLRNGQLNLNAGGVALSTDWPLVGGPGPRFAPAGAPNVACGKSRAADGVAGSSRAQEEALNPGLWQRGAQAESSKVQYVLPGEPHPAGILVGQIHPGSPVDQRSSIVDFNTRGAENYGLLPDMIQDARMIGMSDAAVRVLMNSADRYVHMWERSLAVSGCVGAYDSSSVERCTGDLNPAGVPQDLIQVPNSICANTCPQNPGFGMDLRPNGLPFDFEND